MVQFNLTKEIGAERIGAFAVQSSSDLSSSCCATRLRSVLFQDLKNATRFEIHLQIHHLDVLDGVPKTSLWESGLGQ
jgi:hypothetical protein